MRGRRVNYLLLLVFSADLHSLHTGLSFGLCFEHSVIDHGRSCAGGLLIHNCAFLCRGVANHVVFGRCSRRGLRERGRSC